MQQTKPALSHCPVEEMQVGKGSICRDAPAGEATSPTGQLKELWPCITGVEGSWSELFLLPDKRRFKKKNIMMIIIILLILIIIQTSNSDSQG